MSVNRRFCMSTFQYRMDWKPIKFNWNRMRAFLVTAEEGSLSAAARALDSSQPTLGRQVSALEEELGLALFERVGAKLILTPGGLELLDHARATSDAATQRRARHCRPRDNPSRLKGRFAFPWAKYSPVAHCRRSLKNYGRNSRAARSKLLPATAQVIYGVVKRTSPSAEAN